LYVPALVFPAETRQASRPPLYVGVVPAERGGAAVFVWRRGEPAPESFMTDLRGLSWDAIPGAQILAQDGDIALVSIQQPDQNILRRALAGTARAKESENLTRLDREGDVANGRPLAARISKAERVNVDNGHLRWTVAALSAVKCTTLDCPQVRDRC
jgi:hypothetical protein